jgi:hypothetical protein
MRQGVFVVFVVIAAVFLWGRTTPRAESLAPKLNMIVVCAKCIPDDMPQESYNSGNILLDQNTGNLWFYPALSPGVKPRLLGRFTEPGQPLQAVK